MRHCGVRSIVTVPCLTPLGRFLLACWQDAESDKPGPVVGAEVEECDDLPEHSAALRRIDGDTGTVTHEVSRGSCGGDPGGRGDREWRKVGLGCEE